MASSSSKFFERHDGSVSLRIRVKPRASKSRVLGEREGELEVAVSAPPVDGAANEELVRVLADHFEVPKSTITIFRGATGRSKIVRISSVPWKLAGRV
jgi:uncharacterized protein (TIGR00251 family)